MAKKNNAHTFDFTGILNAEINQQDWKAKKKLLEDQFGKFKMALDTDLAEAEAQKILDMFNEKLNIQLNVEQVKKDAEAVKKIIENALASINNIDTSALRGIEDTLEGIAETTKGIFDKMGSNAQKASKKTIASVATIDKALEKLGGNFASVQEALDFEIKGGAEKQLEAVRKEQEKLNEALKGDDWVKQQEALVRYTKAFEIYQDKVKNNAKKIPQDLSDLYHANVGKANDAKINLQHIVDRHDKKWSGETGSGVGNINVDTSKLATEETLGKIAKKLDNLKISVDDGGGKNNKSPSQENIVDNNDINSVLQNAIQNTLDGALMASKKHANKELSDDAYTYYKEDLIGGMQNHPKIEWSTDIYDILNNALENELPIKEIMTMLKPLASLKHVDSVSKTNTQPVVNDGTSVAINETTLGNAIANALKGVRLNANTQGEVKASIDATELKNVLHDGTPYDVKVVQDGGNGKSVSAPGVSEDLDRKKTRLATINRALEDINPSDKVRDNKDTTEYWYQQKHIGNGSAYEGLIKYVEAYNKVKSSGSKDQKWLDQYMPTEEDLARYKTVKEKIIQEKQQLEAELSTVKVKSQESAVSPKTTTTPNQQLSAENGTTVAIDEAALTTVLQNVFNTILTPKNNDNEIWAKDTTLGEVKGVLESIKTNTDKFVADNTDPRAETLKNEIQALKTKHPNDLFEAADNQKLITDKENELNNLSGKSVNYTQIATALVQIASVLTAKTIEAAIGANTNAVEIFTQHLSGQTSYFESLQQILGGIADAFKQSNISTTIITTGNVLEALNNTLNGVSRLVAVPTGSDVTPQQISVDSVSVNEKANGLSKRKILTDANGKPKRQADTVVERTSNAVKTKTQLFEYDKTGNPIPSDILTVEDFDKFVKEQKSERQKIDAGKAKLKEFLTQFNNKTLGKAEQISGYSAVSDLLDPTKTTWDLDTIEKAKQGMLSLNAEFNKLSQNFRKGSSSLNPFVNAINNTEKLESQIKNIQLDFTALKNAPDELYTTVGGLQGDFANVMSLKDGEDIEAYSLAYGNLREKIVKVVNEIRILRKEQGITQKSALFDENKEVISVRSDTQVQEWERMSYIPDELRNKFRLLHSELNNVVDQDELNIWKKQWEQIRVQITALRREHQGMEADLKEVLTIYEEIGRNEAKIEGLQSEGEKDVYRKRNLALEEEAKELAKIYGLNVDLAAIEKARADAKNSGMVRVDVAQERKSLQERIKADRKAARINASNTKLNAGNNTLDALWKIDDDSIDVSAIPAVKQLENALNSLAKAQERADHAIKNNTQDAPEAIKSLKAHSQVVAGLTADVKELISNYERFSGTNATELGGFAGGDWEQQVTTAIQAQYPGAKIKSINHDLQEVTYELKTGARAFTEYTAGVRQADNKIVALKGTTKKLPTFLEGVKRKLGEISQYFSAMSVISRAMQELRKGLQYVKEIDLALTELKKVTDETEATYDKFLDTASKTAARVGSTIRDVVSSTADWARLGYSMEQAAKFAESTQILMNVSEFTDVSQATDTLISAVQAFGYTAETSMDVVDLLNMIGNNYAVSTADLAQSLTKSSASLVAAGGNLAEAAALTATANAIVQDADAVGKYIACRL